MTRTNCPIISTLHRDMSRIVASSTPNLMNLVLSSLHFSGVARRIDTSDLISHRRTDQSMAVDFSRTLRALDVDRGRASRWIIAIVIPLLAAWGGWFVFARVTVRERSADARLVMGGAPVGVQPDVSGKIISSNLRVGGLVEAGDVLLELDATILHREEAEVRARIEGARRELEALERQLATQESALVETVTASTAGVTESEKQFDVAKVNADFALEEARRLRELSARGDASELELLRANAAAEHARLSAEAAKLGIERVRSEGQANVESRRVACETLRRDRERLIGDRAQAEEQAGALEKEIERRVIRAPVSGRVGDAADLRPGAFVREGQLVASVIPEERLSIVAHFDPAAAVGRVEAGQPALMSFDAFPWGQFGSVPVKVSRVGQEPRDGRIRVECDLSLPVTTTIPLQHGLTGQLDVEVERISPMALVLRVIGGGQRSQSSAAVRAGAMP